MKKIMVMSAMVMVMVGCALMANATYFGQKYEPAAGKVYHGMGQYVPVFYTDQENWSYVTDYQSAVNKTPFIYSIYASVNPQTTIYNPDFSDFVDNHGNPYILLVGISYLNPDWSIDMTAALRGDWDSQITNLANQLKALNKPVFIRPGFEFGEGSQGVHGSPNLRPDEFKTFWIRMHNIFTQNGVTNVAWVWNAVNPDQFNYMNYYPGDNYVDWWGINYFTQGQITNGDNFLILAAAHQKPVMICESCPIENNGTDNSENWQSWFIPYFNTIDSFPNLKAFVYISNPWDKPSFFDSWPNSQIHTNPFIAQNYSAKISGVQFVHMSENISSPVINSFTASPTPITLGQSSTLSWITSGSTSASIDNGIGTVALAGSRTVSPATTTVYALTATNSIVATTSSVTVVVNPPANSVYKPTTYAVSQGSYYSGNSTSLVADDNNYLRTRSVASGLTQYATTDFDFTGVRTSLTRLNFEVRAKSSVVSTNIKLYLYNIITRKWDQIDSYSLGTSESSRLRIVSSNISEYLNSSGTVRLRVQSSKLALSYYFYYELISLK